MVQPPFPFSAHLWLPLTPSPSALPLLPPLCSNSKACLHNLCNCIVPTLGLTVDQHQSHLDLVPTPRATIYIPFLHLSYLPDPFSLTITLSLFNSFLLNSAQVKSPPCTYPSLHAITILLRHPAGIYPLECLFCRYIRALQVLGCSMFLVSDMP